MKTRILQTTILGAGLLLAFATTQASAVPVFRIIPGTALTSNVPEPQPPGYGPGIPGGVPGFVGAQLLVVDSINPLATNPVNVQFFYLGKGNSTNITSFSVGNSTINGTDPYLREINYTATEGTPIPFFLTTNAPAGSACNVPGTPVGCTGPGTIPGRGDWLGFSANPTNGVFGGVFIGFADGAGAADADVNDFMVLASLPEPTTMALFGVGMLGLGAIRRRRHG